MDPKGFLLSAGSAAIAAFTAIPAEITGDFLGGIRF